MAIDTQLAAAKINLTLRILGRRLDGYHELRSIVVFADIGDQLGFDGERPRGVTVQGPFAAAIEGENLVEKALTLLHDQYPQLRLGHITLHKNLPVASGIGGGSADAAAALRLIARANPRESAGVDWQKITLALGADVGVCLKSVPALMLGAGERVEPFKKFPPLSAVLANPRCDVPPRKTAAVFAALGATKFVPEELSKNVAPEPAEAMPPRQLDLAAAMQQIAKERNDLQTHCAQLMPSVGGVIAALEASPGCRLARLSGAGPTCFALYDDAEIAAAASQNLIRDHPSWWVKPVALGGAG